MVHFFLCDLDNDTCCCSLSHGLLRIELMRICITFVPQVMSQAEGQQKNLVHSIDSLPTRGPLSCLDQDLLLLKATSAATLSCLGECLNILQQTQSHSQAPSQPSERHHAAQRAPSGESAPDPISVLVLEPLTPVISPIHHVFAVPSSSGL